MNREFQKNYSIKKTNHFLKNVNNTIVKKTI